MSLGRSGDSQWIVSTGGADTRRMYADDLVVGDVFEVGAYTFSREEIVEFGEKWDPLPIHVDDVGAANSRFGELIASGIHVVAAMQRLTTDSLYASSSMIAGRCIRVARLRAPVGAGTTLVGQVRVDDVRPRERGDALVTLRGQLFDFKEELVFEMIVESIWLLKPKSG